MILSDLLVRYLRLPDHPAKYRLVRWLGRHVFPTEGVIAEVEPGVRLRLHPSDWIEYVLLRDGRYEPATLNFLARNLRPADSALLAGVNNGLHVIVAAMAVGRTGCVVGVEPQPAALLRARVNIELNGVGERVHLVGSAVGAASTLAHMAWSSPENPGATSLFDPGPGLLVPLVPLSHILRVLDLDHLRLILLDVQGYEFPALEGLASHSLPDLLVVEDSPEYLARAGIPRERLYARLIEMGYTLHDLYGHSMTSQGEPPLESNVVGLREGAEVNWCERPQSSKNGRDREI